MKLKKKTLGNKLRIVRKKLGLCQKDFCKKLRITQGMISSVEGGRHMPSLQLLEDIRHNYGVEIDDFIRLSTNELKAMEIKQVK